MKKTNVMETLQGYANTAKRNYEAGCVVAYMTALETLGEALRKYNRFGKKYALQGWQVVKI